MPAALVDVIALVQRPKELACALRRLGAAQKQVTVLAQPIVERFEDHLLQVPLEVDQQVAADDQIRREKGGSWSRLWAVKSTRARTSGCTW